MYYFYIIICLVVSLNMKPLRSFISPLNANKANPTSLIMNPSSDGGSGVNHK